MTENNTESSVKKGTDYEIFVQSVYQAFLSQSEMKNIKVQHNVNVCGKSGCSHQIDVLWEFELGGHVYKTAVECKAFADNVSIGRIRDFYGVLVDIPNLNGIFATLVGYQAGAKKYADHYGISLKELRKPTTEDWEGKVKNIMISLDIINIDITLFSPIPEPKYIDEHPDLLKTPLRINNYDKIIFDKNHTPLMSYEDLRNDLPHNSIPCADKEYTLDLPNHILRTNNENIPISGIKFKYNVNVQGKSIKILGDEIAKAIIKDVKSGDFVLIKEFT